MLDITRVEFDFLFYFQCRQTPIMLACESFLDRLSKMDFLDEKGADFLAKDNVSLVLFKR